MDIRHEKYAMFLARLSAAKFDVAERRFTNLKGMNHA
jgi:hypothetical protein